MDEIEKLLDLIFSETARISCLTPQELEAWKASGECDVVPACIPLPHGGYALLSKAADQAVDEVVDALVDVNDLQKFDVKLLRGFVKSCLGEAMTLKLPKFDSAGQLFAMLSLYLQARTREWNGRFIHYVPCALFVDPDGDKPFSIGPINFVPRELFENPAEKVTPAPWIALGGFGSKRGPKEDAKPWDGLVASLSGCTWVAWTQAELLDISTTTEDSLVHTELAIYAIQLLFPGRGTRTLRHKWERRPPLMIQRLTQIEGPNKFLRKQIVPDDGVSHVRGLVAAIEGSADIALVGDRLWAVIRGDGEQLSPKVSERWLAALFWFGKALRESLDSAAIIALGAALDIFVRGSGKVEEMIRFCSGLLRLPRSAHVAAGGVTLEQMVTLVYSEGRSQLIHGSRPMVKVGYQGLRLQAELFIEKILILALREIGAGVSNRKKKPAIPDNFDNFIRAISSRHSM